MQTFTWEPAYAQKLDAWVSTIRNLARAHGVAHRVSINAAVKEVRKPPTATDNPRARLDRSFKLAVAGGIPEEELKSIRALIFD
jgi:3-keto-L-gulonate-6-phosphate decarboxylase